MSKKKPFRTTKAAPRRAVNRPQQHPSLKNSEWYQRAAQAISITSLRNRGASAWAGSAQLRQ